MYVFFLEVNLLRLSFSLSLSLHLTHLLFFQFLFGQQRMCWLVCSRSTYRLEWKRRVQTWMKANCRQSDASCRPFFLNFYDLCVFVCHLLGPNKKAATKSFCGRLCLEINFRFFWFPNKMQQHTASLVAGSFDYKKKHVCSKPFNFVALKFFSFHTHPHTHTHWLSSW